MYQSKQRAYVSFKQKTSLLLPDRIFVQKSILNSDKNSA